VAQLTEQLEQLRFEGRRTGRGDEERERLVRLALDFRAQAAQANGLELRELLRPWLASAVVDKDAMTLTLGIRLVPADVGLLFNSARAAPGGYPYAPLSVAIIELPASPVRQVEDWPSAAGGRHARVIGISARRAPLSESHVRVAFHPPKESCMRPAGAKSSTCCWAQSGNTNALDEVFESVGEEVTFWGGCLRGKPEA
jgi:hypothetical protein